ncbi:hypothetical protein [Sulfurimonas sp.]|uniref:hypothetical protein n=1 Tax=Sulfurimonas sp. TaxID=2022749 RepID=UPI003569928F
MKKNILISGLVATSMVIFSGCASKMEAPQNSGFFNCYEAFNNTSKFIGDTTELSKYKKVYVEDVIVISAIDDKEQTQSQKNLYKEISKYATSRLKEALEFKNSDKKSNNTLVLSGAISASEVHFEDKNWNQLSPLALGITVVSLNAYLDESARLVGEYSLDAENKTLARSLKLIKEIPISLNDDFLTLDDLKKPIDAWVENVASEINKGIK